MNNSNHNIPSTLKKKRTGLMKARIASNHVLKGPDGKNRSFVVREKMRFSHANMVCVCLLCKKTYEDEASLISAHPETVIMRRQDEAHVYAWWSEDAIVPSEAVKSGKEGKDKDPQKSFDPSTIIGLLSDEE